MISEALAKFKKTKQQNDSVGSKAKNTEKNEEQPTALTKEAEKQANEGHSCGCC